jgi:hypothetical protein
MKIIHYLFLLIIIFILKSCANISPPTGGPKDKNPPKVIKSNPSNNTRNFLGKRITLYFNEKIAFNNLQDQLLINPSPNSNYASAIKKNVVTIVFDKALDTNTTYTLNFREAIKDVTESNIAQNVEIAFSTGSDLDTCIITGTVKDLLTDLPVENAIISLYDANDTFDIKNSKPLYFTKSKKTGDFILRNIKKDTYRIYALFDINKNFIYDIPKEKLAFKDTIQVSGNRSIDLSIAQTNTLKLKITNSKSISEYEYEITMNKVLAFGELKIDTITIQISF